jgi:hypothetical protein
MQNYGSSFHTVAGVFAVPVEFLRGTDHEFEAALEYWSEQPCQLHLCLYQGDTPIDLGLLPPASGGWQQHTARRQEEVAAPAPADPRPEINATGQQGSGAITVTNVRCVNAAGHETYQFTHGEPVELQIVYRINKPDLCEHSQVLIALHRDGVRDICRFITRDLLFDAAESPGGTVRVRLPRLPLGDGTYTVTVMVAQEGYYDREQTLFYSINPGVYACLVRLFEVVVQKGGLVGSGTGVVLDAEWSLTTESGAGAFPAEEVAHEAA